MKNGTILLFISMLSSACFSQQVAETVSIGVGQTNQTWYSLENGDQGTHVADDWDIAFDVSSSFGTSININSENGVELWIYPNGDASDWTSVDTSGISQWVSVYNSDTSWFSGAFDVTADPNDSFDVGWGIYDMVTHEIQGDSIHIIKLTDGAYKKLKIESLVNGTYNFTYANIDGTDEVSATLSKSDFTDKLYGYYSLVDDVERDREPVGTGAWDLLFTKHTEFIPVAYPVASILLNPQLEAAEVNGVADPANYSDHSSATFMTPINTIGYDWKTFNGSGYDIANDLVYFVRNEDDEIWKIVPTGFGGNASGDFEFDIEKLETASLENLESEAANLKLYPNPTSRNEINLVWTSQENQSLIAKIISTSGKQVKSLPVNAVSGLNQFKFDISGLESGVYFVSLTNAYNTVTKKLIINK